MFSGGNITHVDALALAPFVNATSPDREEQTPVIGGGITVTNRPATPGVRLILCAGQAQ